MDLFWDFISNKRCEINEHEIQGYATDEELMLVIKYKGLEKAKYLTMIDEGRSDIATEYRIRIAKKISKDEIFREIFKAFFEDAKPEPKYDLDKFYIMVWTGKRLKRSELFESEKVQ